MVFCSIQAKDSRGGLSIVISVDITICACVNSGECDSQSLQPGYNETDLFKIQDCICPQAYRGIDHCLGLL